MNTILLNPLTWDLALDAGNNMAVASEPLSMAQDAASNIKLFAGELYLDTTLGIPYFSQILGFSPPLSLLKTYFVQAALQVPEVASAKCFITSITSRVVSGQVQITAEDGSAAAVSF